MRFDSRPTGAGDWENEFTFRPTGFPPVFGNENCAGDGATGNAYVRLLNLYVNYRTSPNRWQLDIRGGETPYLRDTMGPGRGTSIAPLDLGPVVVGETLKLKFDVVFDYQYGAATVWENDNPTPIYNNRDRPLGWHYDCDGTTDLPTSPSRCSTASIADDCPAHFYSAASVSHFEPEDNRLVPLPSTSRSSIPPTLSCYASKGFELLR